MIKLAVEVAKRRVPVIAGTGSNSTDEAISLTKHAKEAGADGALLITPYYNKPTQEGMYRHYKAVAEAVEIPQILYNIPSRTGVNMLPAFGPPTWSIIVLYGLNTHLPVLSLVIVGALASASGRLLLAHGFRLLGTYVPVKTKNNLEAAHALLLSRKRNLILDFLGFGENP